MAEDSQNDKSESAASLLDHANRAYDLYLERRREIELRAQQLLGVAAILLALLSWFLPSLLSVSAADKAKALIAKPQFLWVQWAYLLGLICYFLSALLALAALTISKWISAVILTWEDVENFKAGLFEKSSFEKKSLFAIQQAVDLLRKQNATKYNFLQAGFISLILGILSVAIFCGRFFSLIVEQ